ncbi:MAG: hypothetical protein EA350_13560 [Gemmatimonadales bacterium]|nr:MAG: hypothetical protein EA350_13560 [Gemmatimonadales bacterium]
MIHDANPAAAPNGTTSFLVTFLLALALGTAGCGDGASPPAAGGSAAGAGAEGALADVAAAGTRDLAPEQEAFWARLLAHCGQAYPGEVSDATPYYREGVTGRRAVMHVMECSEDRIHIPFHLDDNASRNWIITRADGTLRLKHDHRNPDGSEEEISQYGGDAPVPGLATRQIFPADAHTTRILPERHDNFWFFDFVDDETLQYGVHWPTAGHSVRFSFDLSTPVEPPPAPWGY